MPYTHSPLVPVLRLSAQTWADLRFPFKYNLGFSLSMPVLSFSLLNLSILLVYLIIGKGHQSMDYHQPQIVF